MTEFELGKRQGELAVQQALVKCLLGEIPEPLAAWTPRFSNVMLPLIQFAKDIKDHIGGKRVYWVEQRIKNDAEFSEMVNLTYTRTLEQEISKPKGHMMME